MKKNQKMKNWTRRNSKKLPLLLWPPLLSRKVFKQVTKLHHKVCTALFLEMLSFELDKF